MHLYFFVTAALIASVACQSHNTTVSSVLEQAKRAALARFTDSRVPERDQDIRNAFNHNNNAGIIETTTARIVQTPIVLGVEIPAGSTIIQPVSSQQTQQQSSQNFASPNNQQVNTL